MYSRAVSSNLLFTNSVGFSEHTILKSKWNIPIRFDRTSFRKQSTPHWSEKPLRWNQWICSHINRCVYSKTVLRDDMFNLRELKSCYSSRIRTWLRWPGCTSNTYRVISEAVFLLVNCIVYAFPLWIVGRIITSRPGNVTSPGRRTALCCRTPRNTHNSLPATSGGPHLSSCKSSSHDKMGD